MDEIATVGDMSRQAVAMTEESRWRGFNVPVAKLWTFSLIVDNNADSALPLSVRPDFHPMPSQGKADDQPMLTIAIAPSPRNNACGNIHDPFTMNRYPTSLACALRKVIS